MKAKKHKEKEKKPLKTILIILIIISILMILSGCFYVFLDKNFHFSIIGDKTVEVDVNKKYLESGAIATFFDKKINNIKIKDNIDNTKLGVYKVNYTSQFLFITKRLQRKVIVRDLEKPTIELKGEKNVYLSIGETYKEAGYTAKDNVDGDITSKVVVNNNVDINKVGKYVIKYTIVDSSKNTTSIERNVEVVDKATVLNLPLASFKLDDVYSDVILKSEPNKEYNYFNDTIFLGDSNVAFLYQHGRYISSKQAWGMYNLNIVQINSSTFTTFIDGNSTNLSTALSIYKPKYLIVSVGINTILNMNRENLIKETQNLIDNMNKNYPNTKLIFSGVFPIYAGTLNGNHQYTINQYNYYVLEACHKNRIGFINFSDRIKDQSGFASHEYFECTNEANCGFHLNEKGKAYYINYIKHIDLGRNLK